MKLTGITIGVLTITIAATLSSCATYTEKGDKRYSQYRYSEALDNYALVANKDYHVYSQMAKSHLKLSEYEKATEDFAKAQEEAPLTRDDQYLYAQSLQAAGNYDEAEWQYFQYVLSNPEDDRALKRLEYIQSAEMQQPAEHVDLELVSISNPKYSDYNPVIFGNNLYFTSDRNESDDNKKTGWTERPYTEMYVTKMDNNGRLLSTEIFAEGIQSEFSDGALCFAPNGQYVYFTAHNLGKGANKILSKDNVLELQIYKSLINPDGSWGKPEKVAFNSKEYSCMHPAITSDMQWMYFVSDMHSEEDDYDLYVAKLDENGNPGTPLRLQNNINTKNNELFPTINTIDGVEYLYFSSAGHEGPGGLDIHRIRQDLVFFGETECLPQPYNSTKDDMSFVTTLDGQVGFLSSNRDNDDGIDNIYAFDASNPDLLTVYVYDEEFNTVETDYIETEITEVGSTNDVNMVPNDTAKFIKTVDYEKKYILEVKGDGYEDAAYIIDPKDFSDESDTLSVAVVLDRKDNTTTIYEPAPIDDIYYDYDKSELTAEAKGKLEVIADTLIKNPDLEVKLSAHADSRGDDEYNMKLSQERLASAEKYLMSCGVAEHRINGEYKGEKQLLNNCDEGVICDEKQHENNRRVEIELVPSTVQYSAKSE